MKKFIFTICILLSFSSIAQNLIMNPDFEKNNGCPTGLGQFYLSTGWNSPNGGTPDYFNDCSASFEFGTEFNKKGGQIPHSGHAYMGIQVSNLHFNEYYEYLQATLINPLETGQRYCLKIFVSSGNADCFLNELGAVLSQTKVNLVEPRRFVLPYTPLRGESTLADTISWTCLAGIYTAKGGEKQLTIGDFSNKENFIRQRMNPKLDSSFLSAYYFIDDISLEVIKDPLECNCSR